ncbi:MAG: hypothetical protein ACXWQ6_09225 [Candidatus Limnocylindrales bacterium]
MRHDHRFALALHQEHARELRQAAAAHRLARLHARSARRRAGFRQHVGRSLVHLGSRVAADPSLAPARSP